MDNLILQRAQSAVLSRDFSLAARLYKTLLKSEPDNAELLNALGSLYVKSGEDEKAIPYYESILTFSPHDIYAMNSLGGIYRRIKQYEKGIEILTRALEENQKTGMINYTLGFTYKDMGNYDDAIECFENVVAENPSDVLAYNHLGFIYAAKRNYPKAVQAYRRGLQTDPNHPILHYNLGHAYESDRNYSEAVLNYELALKAKPGWIDAIRDVVKLLLKLQNTKRAMEIVQKSVLLYPSNAELISLAGSVQLKRYDFEEAQKTFEKADRLKTNDSDILLKLAESLEKQYLPGDAASYAKEARVIGFKDSSQKKRYVHIMLSADEFERASQVIDELLDEAPSDAGVIDAKAQYCILTDDEAGKEEMFGHIAEMNPRYRHHYLEAARRYCQKKKYDEALACAEKYISLASLNPAGYNIKGRILERMGNIEEAVKTYKIAANLKYEDIYAKKELKRLGHTWNENLQNDVSDYIAKLNEQEKEEEAKRIMAEEQAAAELEEQMIEKEVAAFDFSVMGDTVKEDDEMPDPSVPLLAELSEDEGFSGLDEIDEDTDRLMEEEKEPEEDDLSEIMAAKPKKAKPVETDEEFELDDDDEDQYVPDWDEPAESKPNKKKKPLPKTVDADIDDFLGDEYSADDSYSGSDDPLDMLRDDTVPKMDSRLEEKIDDAVEKLEEAVSDVNEKAEEAMRKAEEAASRLNSELGDLSSYGEPGFGGGSGGGSMGSVPFDDPVYGHAKEGFNEPDFSAPYEMKDPFDNVVTPDHDIGVSAASGLAANDPIYQRTEQAFNDATKFLPNIVRIIEDEKIPEQYKEELGLFSRLRELSDYLPPEKKDEFMASKTRMLMDYVIGKMSGKPGLAKTVENLLKSGILDDTNCCSELNGEDAELEGKELAKKVISSLKELTADLEDQHLATALNNSADEVLAKL